MNVLDAFLGWVDRKLETALMPTQAPGTVAKVIALTAWGEARDQGQTGMQAVVNVIHQRAFLQPGWWGMNPVAVCQHASHGIYQFDCWDPHGPNLHELNKINPLDLQYKIALALAEEMLNQKLEDITNGSDSYYRIGSTKPVWAQSKWYRKTIKNQAFYRVGLQGDGAPMTTEQLNQEQLDS